jgi:hypothetical protein
MIGLEGSTYESFEKGKAGQKLCNSKSTEDVGLRQLRRGLLEMDIGGKIQGYLALHHDLQQSVSTMLAPKTSLTSR